MTCDALFFYDPVELHYRFNDQHPFNQQRLSLTVDLLQTLHALPPASVIKPRKAEEDELRLVHSSEYVRIVKAVSEAHPSENVLREADRYGLGTEDTPCFPDMHEMASIVVGGSLLAAESVMEGRARHALHLGGGLHHAMPNKGAGFCVYNDAAVAIAHIRQKYKAKVLYVDTDVHHGDGVQWSFYTDHDVVTFSIHETGKFLFPGTGSVGERGEGLGFGACINMPVEPYTEDESWMECFEDILSRVVAATRPDVIVSQHGCDAHAFDPLAHVHCSMEIYKRMPERIRELAIKYCQGRWLALGGGGYDIWRVVPRAWSLLWLVMSGNPLVQELEANQQLKLPKEWLQRWQRQSPEQMPAAWLDDTADWDPMPRRAEITAKNRAVKNVALQYLPPVHS